MIKKLIILTAFLFVVSGHCEANTSFETEWFRLTINEKGSITSIYDKTGKTEYFAAGQKAPLLSIRYGGLIEEPARLKREGSFITLYYPGNKAEARIGVKIRQNYITLELISLTSSENTELVIWGPYPVSIGQTIGECAGVVRNNDFAVGIQALNVKTLGGYPSEESDIEPSYDIFSTGNYTDIEGDWKSRKNYRGQTARIQDFGSVIQAYTRNRNKERIIKNWGHTSYVAPLFSDGGVIGSKIALFGCPENETLELLGQIEIAEGLPHPLIDGEWAKTARTATSSYLIIGFTEENLDQALELTKKAGLKYLYHGHPFSTWGHFNLIEESFPDNWSSLKRCVERAGDQGIRLGVHTLTNFINTDDPYVSPVPDPRLARVGESILTKDIDSESDEIDIESPLFFNQMENNTLKSVVIDSEIIRYREVSKSEPWKITGCVRGAFNTVPSAHKKGAVAGKLMDHAYRVFLSDPDLSVEIAKTLARLFNETGLMQLSFDGLEGVWSTGMGQYARSLFTKTWYDNLNNELKGKVINDASNPSHFNWHINTRYNWGEPWYAGFRESQTYYRLMNQDFYRRNFIPSMLGWFSMSSTTSVEDAEWLLARAAGFDAGFAFNLSFENVQKNGCSDAIFNAIRTWETARMAGAFSAELKLQLQDIGREFHLDSEGEESWNLYPFKIERYVHEQRIKQPGEPLQSRFEFENSYQDQPPAFIISLVAGENNPQASVRSISLEINNHNVVTIPVNMKTNQHLKMDAGGSLQLFDQNWKPVRFIECEGKLPALVSGKNTIIFGADFSGGEDSMLKAEFKTKGTAITISAATR